MTISLLIGVLGSLAAGVRGEWNFNPDGTGTVIRWTYEFKPLPGRRLIIAGPFAPLWRRYMAAALAHSPSGDTGCSRLKIAPQP